MKDISFIIEIVLAVLSLIMFVSTIISGYKCAKATVNKDEATAARYGIIERTCSKLFWVSFITLVVVLHQDLMSTGFAKIITILEELLHG